MNELIRIDQGAKISARDLYEFLDLAKGQFSRWAKSYILENQFAANGVDYEGFDIVVEGNDTVDYRLSIDFAKKLCMVSKSLKGELARNYFVEVEKRYNKISQPVALEDLIIMQAQSVKELKAVVKEQGQQLAVIKDTIITRDDNWRDWVNNRLNAISKQRSGAFHEVRTESYDLLEARAACLLAIRVNHLRARLQNAGGTKAQINAVNKLDVIEADVRLKEIYTAIVKEMVIRYVA